MGVFRKTLAGEGEVYGNRRAELERVETLMALRAEVSSGACREPKHRLEVTDAEVEAFVAGMG